MSRLRRQQSGAGGSKQVSQTVVHNGDQPPFIRGHYEDRTSSRRICGPWTASQDDSTGCPGPNARARPQPRQAAVSELSDGDHHQHQQQAQHDGLEPQPRPLLHHALALLLPPLLRGQSAEREAQVSTLQGHAGQIPWLLLSCQRYLIPTIFMLSCQYWLRKICCFYYIGSKYTSNIRNV